MSVLSSVPIKVAPPAAAGATLTTAASAWTSGAWVELLSATSAAAHLLGIYQNTSATGAVQYEVDIGVGASGSESVLSTFRINCGSFGIAQTGTIWMPIAVSGIGNGDRISARARCSQAGGGATIQVAAHYAESFAADSIASALRHLPSAAALATLTPSGTGWANSAYSEITSSLASNALAAGLSLSRGVGGVDYELDIATGSAGAEVVKQTIRGSSKSTASTGGNPHLDYLPAVYDALASGARVAWRLRKSGTDTATWGAGLVYYGAEAVALQKVTQLVVLVGYDEYVEQPPTAGLCAGGGTVASGANPSDGTGISTSSKLHAWIETGDIGGTIYRWAKVGIPHGNPKTPRVLSFGSLTRALSDDKGGFEGSAMTITLSDYDRTLRGLQATQTLLNKTVTVYVADEATIAANGTPWKVFRGVVRDFEPESELKFRITIEDPLTLTMSAFAQEKLVPPTLISVSDGTADQGLRESPVPVLYGALSDEDQDTPIGTIEAPFIGTETVAGHADLGNLHKHLIGLSACGSVKSVFLADPASGDPPTARAKAPASDYGTSIYVPHQNGWFLSTLYSVEDGERWTFLYLDQNHPAADLARYNRIPIAVNVCGREETGDATGDTIDSLPLQFLHFLNTEVAQDVGDANWPAIAQRDSYSLFDTTTFTTTKQRSESRISGGYKGAFMLGHGYQQITLREAMRQFCQSGDFSLGINRHGQIILSMLDITATTGAVTFTDQSDILKDSFRINPRLDAVENRVRYAYKRNYLKTIQQPNPEIGSRLPREPFDSTWLSRTQTLNDTTEQTNLGEVRSSQLLELEMVRHQETADDVAARRLALRKPSNGRAEATWRSTLSKGYSVELGDLVNVTHFQGIGSTGWTNKRCRVLRIVDDLDVFTRQFTAQDVDNLLVQAPASGAVQWDGDDVVWDGEIVTEFL
jgi:hypothetical protein